MEPIIELHPGVGWLVALAILVTTFAAAWKAVGIPLLRGIHKIGNFLDEWNGGVGDKKSMPKRIEDIEDRMKAVHEQTLTNGGSTLRDAVSRIELQLNEVQRNLSVHFDEARERDQRIEAIEAIEATHTHIHTKVKDDDSN